MNFDIAAYLGLGSVALIAGLSLAIKAVLPAARWYLLINIALGILLNLLIGYYLGLDLVPRLVQGIIAGLAANNSYDQIQSLLDKRKTRQGQENG